MENSTYRLFVGLLFLAFLLLALVLRKRKLTLPVVFVVGVFLGVYRAVQFAHYAVEGMATYPIEISHIAYFTQAGILLSGIPQLQFFAGFLSLCCGIGYFIGAMASPGSMMANLDLFTVVQGVIIHGILLFCGILMLFGIRRYKKRVFLYTFLGLLLIVLFAYLVQSDVLYPGVSKGGYVILKMIDGTLLNYLFPEMAVTPLVRSLTLSFILAVAILLAFLFYFLNHRLVQEEDEKGVEWGAYAWIKQKRASSGHGEGDLR